MIRTLSLAASLALAFAASQARAADAPAKAKAPAKAPAKAAPEAEKPLTQGQLDVAPRVFTGNVQCDGDQKVEVTAIDGKPLKSPTDLPAIINSREPRTPITLSVLRNDKRTSVKITLGVRPKNP